MTRPKPPASTWSRLEQLAEKLDYGKRSKWKLIDRLLDFAEDERNQYLFKNR